MSKHPLNYQMDEIVSFIETAFRNYAFNQQSDSHWSVCRQTADHFNLWEANDSGGESFPLWLSYVVSGIGRDNGILR